MLLALERSIQVERRHIVTLCTDAVGTKEIGVFYTRGISQQPEPDAAFSISLPCYIARAREHINTEELRAVEQALLYWGRQWNSSMVIMHVDNRAVVHDLENETIRGALMAVL